MIIAMDSGYNASRLAWLLADLPVVLVVRVRSNRAFYRAPPPPPPRPRGLRGAAGRGRRHGPPLRCSDPSTWGGQCVATAGESARHGLLEVAAWHRVHQKLLRRDGGWQGHEGDLPAVEGTLIHVAAAAPRPGWGAMWLWASDPAAGEQEVTVLWQAYFRRFDLEHVFRFLRQQLGWSRPLLRDPAAADRWTWLVIACYAQLWLARTLAAARLPWQPPLPPAAVTPGRVRAGFRCARAIVGTPARAAKPSAPGPGRPQGSVNKHKAQRHPVGKNSPKHPRQHKKPRRKPSPTG